MKLVGSTATNCNQTTTGLNSMLCLSTFLDRNGTLPSIPSEVSVLFVLRRPLIQTVRLLGLVYGYRSKSRGLVPVRLNEWENRMAKVLQQYGTCSMAYKMISYLFPLSEQLEKTKR